MTTATGFPLRERVREFLSTTEELDRKVLARKFVGELTDDELRPALEEAIPRFIQERRHHHRMHVDEEAAGGPSRPSTETLNGNGKSRWPGASDLYIKMMKKVENVGPNLDKFLADLSEAEVRLTANVRVQTGQRNLTVGKRYLRLAEVFKAHPKAKVVGDLPEADVLAVFS